MKEVTLCFLTKTKNGKNYICLAMKKRGFGKGRWNGVGGKVNKGETIEEAVIREATEEISSYPKTIVKQALLDFHPMDLRCHVYFAEEWDGEPVESEEMSPQWFHLDEVPFNEMWDSDRLWLPFVLEGKSIRGTFHFDKDDNVIKHVIKEASF